MRKIASAWLTCLDTVVCGVLECVGMGENQSEKMIYIQDKKFDF